MKLGESVKLVCYLSSVGEHVRNSALAAIIELRLILSYRARVV